MALRGTPSLSAIPASQNTAPVNEYRCLFTSDIRRKQKRWHDGYLKFHTFNSRVMVYDTTRNFLGDTYWKEPNEVQEGDELTLDKGIMVEVAEAVGVTQTDLTSILERKKESPQPKNPTSMQRPVSRPTLPPTNAPRTGSQLRHKSLNALLGTPKGPMGKAAPMRSPFEARKEKENRDEEGRASKRQKTTHKPAQHRASSPAGSNEPVPNKSPPIAPKQSDTNIVRTLPKQVSRPITVISLDSEPDNIMSDVTLPSTPPREVGFMPRPKDIPISRNNKRVSTATPAVATPRIPRGRVPVPHVKAQETPRPPPVPSSPPISASNRLSNVDFALQSARKPSVDSGATVEKAKIFPPDVAMIEVSPIHNASKASSSSRSPPQNLKPKSLRLSKGVKRGMLLCQSGLAQKRAPLEPEAARKSKGNRVREPPRQNVVQVISDADTEDTRKQNTMNSEKTVSRVQKKKRSSHLESVTHEPSPVNPSTTLSPDPFDDMELIHGLMDQQLEVVPSNAPNQKVAEKEAQKKAKRVVGASPETQARPKTTKTPTSKEVGANPRAKRKQLENPECPRQDSPHMSPVLGGTGASSVKITKQPTKTADKRPYTASVTISPSKITALSTGGFRMKPKKGQSRSTATISDAPAPRTVTVPLPPHPLRANKSGPLMSTTELSALLTKSTGLAHLEDDPIEDDPPNESPSKSFRRSRSENDASIPSMSEDWEQRNLPKASASKKGTTPAAKPDEAPPSKPRTGGLAALVKKTDPRRKFQRTQSLNVNTNVPGNAEPEVVTPPPLDRDVGPWSTEAFDLFDWRPPNAEETT